MPQRFFLPHGEETTEVEWLRRKVVNQAAQLQRHQERRHKHSYSQLTGPMVALRTILKMGKTAQPLTLSAHMTRVAEDALIAATAENPDWEIRGSSLTPTRGA